MNVNIIKNVKIINHDKIIDCADVEITNGKISKIVPNTNKATLNMIPGLIDTHIHGFMNFDCMEGTYATEQMSKYLAHYGITSFMPTAMTQEWSIILNSLQEISKAKSIGAKIQGIHIEGPFIGESKKGAHKLEFLKKASPQLIKQMYDASNGKLAKISYDPIMVDMNSLEEMKKLNIIPSIGHSSADFELSQKHYQNGATCTCHLWNAMSGVDSRNPGLAQASLMNNDIYAEMIVDFFHISPKTVEFSIEHKTKDRIMMISDAIKPAYSSDGDSFSGGIPITKHGKQIFLKGTNTIAGSAINIFDSFQNLLKLGYNIQDIIKMTSFNAAQNSKLEHTGYITEGNYADIVLLDDNYNISEVYVDGVKKYGNN